jgi:hypothetical protein
MMTEPINYTLSFGMTKLNLSLTDDRFVSRGSMQNLEIPLSSLRYFCVSPVYNQVNTYDAELIVAWDEGGKTKSKKLYVRQTDQSFQDFIGALQQKRPDASLLHLNPKEAQKQMGVTSTNKLAWIIGLAIVGVILLIVVIAGVWSAMSS